MSPSANIINECFIVLGRNISKYRKEKGMTLEEVGLAIGIDKSGLHHIENGKPITIKTLLKISAYLEIPIAEFFKDLPMLSKDDLKVG